jgi:two-component system chemotaxis response regulator CheB
MAQRDIIVIGSSAGGASVLMELVRRLPADLQAAMFIVTHLPAGRPSELAALLDERSPLPIGEAVDGQPIETSRGYVAPPGRHLLLMDRVVRLGRGPHENMARPAVDPLFRSAALAFGSRVIGVILSGFLDDGASGICAVKQRGGLAVVQHPLDAEAPEMPRAALEAVDADHVVNARELPELLVGLAGQPAPESPPPDPGLAFEVRVAAGAGPPPEELAGFAAPSRLTCPHCHGVLSQVETAGPLRFRCQTGHAFSAEAALAAQQRDVDEAVLVALRVMEERCALVSSMAKEARESGRNAVAELYETRAEEYGRYAATLREAAGQPA